MDTPPLILRPEEPSDFRAVEELTRDAFWDLYVPRCNEHYLVHAMRTHEDFLPDLSFVAEFEGNIVGNIMSTRSKLLNKCTATGQQPLTAGRELPTVTFGPLSVCPRHQRQGIGKRLIARVAELANQQGVAALVIHGDPHNYVSSGFRSGKDVGVSAEDGFYPLSLLVKPLAPSLLDGGPWSARFSPVFDVPNDISAFDANFPPRPSAWRPSQELFSILSRAQMPAE